MEIKNMNGDLRIYNINAEAIVYSFPKAPIGGHCGADGALLDNLFKGTAEDPLHQMADLRAGMMSIGIGAAANISMAENRRVNLDEYYKNI